MSVGIVVVGTSNAPIWCGQEKQAVSPATQNHPSFVLTRRCEEFFPRSHEGDVMVNNPELQ